MPTIDQQLDSDKFLLYAINVMLQCINELPLADDTDLANSIEGQVAQSVLIETKKEVLAEGWDVNTDTSYRFVPDPDGNIPVPTNVLDIANPEGTVIMRNWRLYDKTTQSHVFEEAVSCNVVWDLDFNTLPHAIRYYINVKAARTFQGRMIGDQAAYAFAREDEEDAYLSARRSEGRTGRYNMLQSSYGMTYKPGSR